MQLIPLSKRLHTIVEYIPKTGVLADIGTDHAFIPIHAVQLNRVQRAIATDLRSGPLQKARENVAKFGLSGVIDLRLGNGLAPLAPGEADVIVSAGIGGHVHTEMLTSGLAVVQRAARVIFQPMNAGHRLRQALDQLGFRLVDERLVLEDDRVYEIIVAEPTSGQSTPDPAYSAIRHDPHRLAQAYTYGPLLMQAQSPLYQLRLTREIEKLQAVLGNVAQSHNEAAGERAARLRAEIEDMQMLLREGNGDHA
ncbi:SAM-dependent methyltransferase [Alicyclobacillus acidoterrestris]|nr:SAM-dependent methyltransferase [Alicyclobacillus acidoterrestris]